MSLGTFEIAAVVSELAPVVGSRVDAVRLHSERALTLELFGRGGATAVLVSAEPDRTRLHAVERRPPSPPVPYPFQAALRRELEGAVLVSLEARPGDRVVEMTFERGGRRVRLIAELTGRHGNLFLVGEDGAIQGSAGRNLSRRRDLVTGRPYQPPAAREEAGQTSRLVPREGHRFPLSAAIEERYGALEVERATAEARRRLRDPIRAGVARARRALQKLAEEAARIPAAEEDRRRADLLKTHLRAVARGARDALLTEWTEAGPREVRVALDPALSARQNMERYYRRYRRIVESGARVAARRGEMEERLRELLALLEALDQAPLQELPRLEREARRLGAGPRAAPRPRSRRDEPPPPYRTFRSAAGVPLLVGRNAEGNDALTVRVARGNDLWLHARAVAGAHVVARLERGKGPDGETLLDAAHLAAHFSDARGEVVVEVAATRAKYVRKVKGAAPGAVTYSQERTLELRVEPERIERLLASEEEG